MTEKLVVTKRIHSNFYFCRFASETISKVAWIPNGVTTAVVGGHVVDYEYLISDKGPRAIGGDCLVQPVIDQLKRHKLPDGWSESDLTDFEYARTLYKTVIGKLHRQEKELQVPASTDQIRVELNLEWSEWELIDNDRVRFMASTPLGEIEYIAPLKLPGNPYRESTQLWDSASPELLYHIDSFTCVKGNLPLTKYLNLLHREARRISRRESQGNPLLTYFQPVEHLGTASAFTQIFAALP